MWRGHLGLDLGAEPQNRSVDMVVAPGADDDTFQAYWRRELERVSRHPFDNTFLDTNDPATLPYRRSAARQISREMALPSDWPRDVSGELWYCDGAGGRYVQLVDGVCEELLETQNVRLGLDDRDGAIRCHGGPLSPLPPFAGFARCPRPLTLSPSRPQTRFGRPRLGS